MLLEGGRVWSAWFLLVLLRKKLEEPEKSALEGWFGSIFTTWTKELLESRI